MSDVSDETDTLERSEDQARYEAPRIVWREPYQPLTFGVSCAKQPGNPGCNTGPLSS